MAEAGREHTNLLQTVPRAVPAHAESISSVIPYEKRLDGDPRWAMTEGSRFFEQGSKVQDALRKITSRLNELGIPYVVVGGLALFQHGHRRFTEDVDLLAQPPQQAPEIFFFAPKISRR